MSVDLEIQSLWTEGREDADKFNVRQKILMIRMMYSRESHSYLIDQLPNDFDNTFSTADIILMVAEFNRRYS